MPLVRLSLMLLSAASLCGQDRAGAGAQCALPPNPNVAPAAGLVRYCAPAQLAQRNAAVQFLVDGSGSMRGFEGSVPRLYEWAALSFSQLRDLGMTFTKKRSAYFVARKGVTAAKSDLRPGAWSFQGDTNLDEAIAAAHDFDLTLILTDGVATSGRGNGDCAGGVDAACVARAIRRELAPRSGESQMAQGGLWLVPLASMYSGLFHSEQLLANRDFDVARAAASVQTDTSTNGEFGKVEQRDGRLAYQYRGPRAFYFLVLARQAETGRALVAALASSSAGAQIQRLGSLKEFRSGIAMLSPVEVFPGAAPGPVWAGAKVGTKNYKPAVCGVMDLAFGAPDRLKVNCPPGRHSGIVELSVEVESRVSQCVNISLLPASSLSLEGVGSNMIEGFSWGPAGPGPSLLVKLRCEGLWKAACGEGAATVDWKQRPNYAATADRVVGGGPGTSVALVRALSTDEPAHQPVRVTGLSSLLEKFYREISRWQVTLPYAHLRLCRP